MGVTPVPPQIMLMRFLPLKGYCALMSSARCRKPTSDPGVRRRGEGWVSAGRSGV
jgi:hypothetical protein